MCRYDWFFVKLEQRSPTQREKPFRSNALFKETGKLRLSELLFSAAAWKQENQMKAWLWHLLYPMNLWSRFVVYSGSLLKLYNKWMWQPFLEKFLSNNLKVARDRTECSTNYTCVQCGKRVKLALVTHWDNRTNIFCSAGCKDKWAEPDLQGEESEFLPQSFTWIGDNPLIIVGLPVRFDNENHQCPRRLVSWPVTIMTSQRTISVETRDLSPSGAFIYCDRPVTPKHIFFLSIHIHSSTVSLSSMAETVWSSHNGMGVRFHLDHPEQGHLLSKFILDAWRPEDSLFKVNGGVNGSAFLLPRPHHRKFASHTLIYTFASWDLATIPWFKLRKYGVFGSAFFVQGFIS